MVKNILRNAIQVWNYECLSIKDWGKTEAGKDQIPFKLTCIPVANEEAVKNGENHQPIDSRPTAECVCPSLYKLPRDFFVMLMEYLTFRDILYLCQDPGFPLTYLRRKHLSDDKSSISILHQLMADSWSP